MQSVNSFQQSVAFHIATNHLIWKAYQMTGLCKKKKEKEICEKLKFFRKSLLFFYFKDFSLLPGT